MSACPSPATSLPGMNVQARHSSVPVVEQVPLARDTFRLRLHCPDVARQALPGQFFMLRDPRLNDPLLGRPFALYDVWLDAHGHPAGIDIVYLVIGKATHLMQHWTAGDSVELWGPLGNGFPLFTGNRLLLVAGGIGNTPFLAVARETLGQQAYGTRTRGVSASLPQVELCYGVRSREYLAGLDDFASANLPVSIATDDGTAGHRGFVTELVRQQIQSDRPPEAIYCCGPEPMLRAVRQLATASNVPCWISLETPMACGFGACFSCVTRVKLPHGEWDYRRTCIEGPIFRGDELWM